MSIVSNARAHKRLVALAILAGCVLAAAAAPLSGNAAYIVCRTDPIVLLSNGTQVTMYADTQDVLSDIKSVNYDLHAPVGTSVVSTQFDDYGYLETVNFYADQAPGKYKTTTTVNTGVPSLLVTSNATVTAADCGQPPKARTSVVGLPITIAFSC